MIFIGMDVHDKRTTFCLYDPSQESRSQYHTFSRPTTEEAYVAVLEPLKGRCKVAYEVGTQAQWVAKIIRPLAAEVQVANPSQIPWLFRSGRKNDRLDAKKLATLLYLNQLPTVHLPQPAISAWRALINHRRSLVKRRTMIKNQVRTILRSFVVKCPHKSCWTRKGMTWLHSLTFDSARHLMMQLLLEELLRLNESVRRVEKQLDEIAATNPNVALLQSIPGIGPRTSEAIVAFADYVDRFGNSKQFACYFGMTPTEDSSGMVVRHGHISKRGPSVVRWVLVEAVHQSIRRSKKLRQFFDRIHRGKKDRYKKAIVATGRKVLVIAYAIMRDQKVFDESKVIHQAA